MKKTLLLFLLLCSTCLLQAQTVIDNPMFKFRSSSIYNITRIERTPDATRLHIHVIFRPHWWVMIDNNTFLEDVATGKKYYITGSEGFELNKEVYTPDSGTLDFVLLFPSLPKETKEIHFLNDDKDDTSKTFYISLEEKDKKSQSFDKISGNWMGTDDYYEWAFGIYDSLVIMDNRFYSYEDIRQKGKTTLLTLQDDHGDRVKLELTPQKNGLCRIKKDKEPARLYSRTTQSLKAMQKQGVNEPVFRRDTVCVQGYIAGYDRRLGFSNGLIYVSNDLVNDDYPMVIDLLPNGRFECKFEVNNSISKQIVFNNNWIPFYAEPGQTVTIYLDWEAILEQSRSRLHYYPIRDVHYMGSTGYISRVLKYVDEKYVFKYDEFSKMVKELTPEQFRAHCDSKFSSWLSEIDSLVEANQYGEKAARLLKNRIELSKGVFLLDFVMNRQYMAMQDKNSSALKVAEDSAYYNFLRQIPLNDSIIVADKDFGTFINRLEFMNFNRAMGDTTTVHTDKVEFTYPESSVLSYLKEKGVELTPEQDELRKKMEERAGKKMFVPISELVAESDIWKELTEKYNNLFAEFAKMNQPEEEVANEQKSEEEIERGFADRLFEDLQKKVGQLDTIAGYSPFISQIMALRSLNYQLNNLSKANARFLLDKEKRFFSHPFLSDEAERLFREVFPLQADSTYALPEGHATEIFRNIIKPHAGKVLFVDFWATTCGPCRGGIEQTADLRRQYKDHPEFQFVYITSDRESPLKDYNEYVEKHLKGEACYRIPQSDYNYLRQLFRFNGIPHYELIEKDGTISRTQPHTYNLKEYLQKRFGKKE